MEDVSLESVIIDDEDSLPVEVQKLQDSGVKVKEISYGNLRLFVRKPTKDNVNFYFDSMQNRTGSFSTIQENFIKMLIVYPTKEELEALAEEKPAMFMSLSGKILEEAGLVNFSIRELPPKKKK